MLLHGLHISMSEFQFEQYNTHYFQMGPALFFVVSAFTMSVAYREISTKSVLSEYAIRRYFRIAPLFYVMLFGWVYVGMGYNEIQLLQNLTFTFGFFPEAQTSLVAAGWTIGVEAIFYLLFPLIWYWRGILPALLLLGISFIAADLINQQSEETAPQFYFWTHFLTNAPYFAFGLLAWSIYRLVPEQHARLAGLTMLVLGLVSLALTIQYLQLPIGYSAAVGPVPIDYIAGWGVSFGLIVLSQALYPVVFLTNRATVFLGTISYSVYLMHPLFFWYTEIGPWIASIVEHPDLIAPAIALVSVLTVIPIATALYYLLEAPMISLGRKLSKRRSRALQTT